MSLEKKCKQGNIGMDEFIDFALVKAPYRIHCLSVGDYVVSPDIFREDILITEKITELDHLEKGDFLTDKGTTGPINGSVFIKICKEGYSQHMLIVGDRLYTGEDSVHEAVAKYMQNKRAKKVGSK